METATTPRADRLWNLVQELEKEINAVGDQMTLLTEHGDLEEGYRGGKLRFTGWKAHLDVPLSASLDSHGGYVAQWAWYNPNLADWCLYICLPAFCGGQFKRGERLDIGTERVTGNEPDEKIIAMVEAGKILLLEMVDDYLGKPQTEKPVLG